MTPFTRLVGGVLVLSVYGLALKGSVPTVPPPAAGVDADVEAWLTRSREAFEAGRFSDALEPTLRLTERFPSQQVHAERLAQIFGRLGRPADEAAAWERFIALSPTPIDACPAIGDAYLRAGQHAKALEAFERCVSFDPRNAELLFFLGRAYEREGRLAEARESLERAIAVNETYVDIHIVLGRVAERTGRRQEARRHFNRALELSPSRRDEIAPWLQRTAASR